MYKRQKEALDIMALHKLNVFHWHLTDDQGWRIEIRKYPKLSEIGSVRSRTLIGRDPGGTYDENCKFDETPYGGYYTQDEIRDVVNYAAERFITVIPEIEFPGHAVGALASYPWLSCTGEQYEVRQTWDIDDRVFCIGKETTFEFIEGVLEEVLELFPSEYIHIGGDECPKVRWEKCPRCQAKIRQLGLKDDGEHTAEHYLQSYVTDRIGKFLAQHGRRIIGWEIELQESTDQGIKEVLSYQKSEANQEFCKFVRRSYYDWINRRDDDAPVMSHMLMRSKIFPVADENPKTTLLLIDNFRYDQWRSISPLLRGYYDVAVDDFYCAILPTATQYARNAVFAGLMPLSIDKLMPDRWLNDNEEGGKNRYEEEFLRRLMQQNGKQWRFSFDKLVRPEQGRKLVDNIQKVYDADFSVIVYNFLDILSHARTETDIIRELTEDDAAFRSLTRSWFEHSDLYTILKLLSERGHTVVITSDHGTIRVDNPVKVTGDRETSANLRYKTGRNLAYNSRDVYEVLKPEDVQLPSSNLTSSYIFAYNSDFLVYNNDANRHIRYYRNTFQHGGISMEEMIVPYIVLKPKQ